ncbi:ATP-binding protein [Psychrobium sp. 1_MG-2023]|uniref:ATP-binding protein n=1 Tax=Psychrobium sp. 1_MG-2023 TaxID=3062624 RepID=UPI000C32C4B6|nr:ATP-binding protein [Psychrobium sp. 1_MG-2023]MDP2562708.1 PAS domain-containing sensor histidine kinase [Psychrobium sp. 1_MG-2023]PKF54028.1 hypothetical protein CW748_17220 [Alteromonadales bacterium alter-6D02]
MKSYSLGSLRNRFLLIPAIATVLFALLFSASNSIIASHSQLFFKINQDNLPHISKINQLSAQLINNHVNLSTLISDSYQAADEKKFYIDGRVIINNVFNIEEKLTDTISKHHPLLGSGQTISKQATENFTKYRESAVLTIEIASQGSPLAFSQLATTNQHFNQLNTNFLDISNFYLSNISNSQQKIDSTLFDQELIAVISVLLIIIMMLVAWYGAKLMSRDFEAINQALFNLTQQKTDIQLPKSSNYEIAKLVDALVQFKETILTNQYQRAELNEMVAELNQSKDHYFSLLDLTATAIVTIDSQQHIVQFNKAAERMFGYYAEEIIGQPLVLLLPKDARDTHPKKVESFKKKYIEFQQLHGNKLLRGLRKNGQEFFVELDIAKLTINNDSLNMASITDITERLEQQEQLQQRTQQLARSNQELKSHKVRLEQLVKQRTNELMQSESNLTSAQQQLIESEKMVLLGETVASTAHEVNTPLSIGVTAGSHLEEETKQLEHLLETNQLSRSRLEKYTDTVKQSAQIILTNMARAADLVKSFKEVAVDQTSDATREFNLKAYLDEIILSLTPRIKKTTHTVKIDCDSQINLYTRPGAISQIVTNLVNNSLIHAFEDRDGGLITIVGKMINDNVSLEYRDNGVGLSESKLAQIFEPFFTTKRGEGGSGLGMHIVQTLVTQSLKGTVECHSKQGEGITCTMTFPIKVPEITEGD